MIRPLLRLLDKIEKIIQPDDITIFCGDYVDRGADGFEVIEKLLEYASRHQSVFLTGNHEMMLKGYPEGTTSDQTLYLINGGKSTIRSYSQHFGSIFIPETHKKILFSGVFYYAAESFIVVHAGLNPYIDEPGDNDPYEMVWIRDEFFTAEKKWEKTIVFGHTPTHYLGMSLGEVYIDNKRNIIGIDTGAVYGGVLTCLVMPEKTIIQSSQ
ncbi:MAG TPA: metallophosphoesterase [Spirochaetota bacterium]